MKKLLLIATLVLSLVFIIVACTKAPVSTDTTDANDTTIETPTEAPTEPKDTAAESEVPTEPVTTEALTDEPEVPTTEPSEPATTEAPATEPSEPATTEAPATEPSEPATTEAPATEPSEPVGVVTPESAGLVGLSFDSFYANGGGYFPEDGGAGAKLDAINNTIPFELDGVNDSMALRGWIGFNQPIDQFGYYIDDPGNQVYGEWRQDTEDGVKAAGGTHATRFCTTVELGGLTSGEHKVGFIVKLADGTVVLLRTELTMVISTPDDPEVPEVSVGVEGQFTLNKTVFAADEAIIAKADAGTQAWLELHFEQNGAYAGYGWRYVGEGNIPVDEEFDLRNVVYTTGSAYTFTPGKYKIIWYPTGGYDNPVTIEFQILSDEPEVPEVPVGVEGQFTLNKTVFAADEAIIAKAAAGTQAWLELHFEQNGAYAGYGWRYVGEGNIPVDEEFDLRNVVYTTGSAYTFTPGKYKIIWYPTGGYDNPVTIEFQILG